MTHSIVGKVESDAGRLEVCTCKIPFEGVKDGVVYVTKFRNGQIGERSVGMSAEAARAISLLLTQAASRLESAP